MTARRALILILGAAAALRIWGLAFGLPHNRTRPDEEFLAGMALHFFGGDYNPRFFLWPSAYFYVAHGVARLWYWWGAAAGEYRHVHDFVRSVADDPTRFYLSLRLLSAAAGVATVAAVHDVARRVFDRPTALTAAGFLAVAFLHVRDSHFGVLDVPLTLLVVLAVRALVAGRGRWTSFALAGALVGFATSIKYNAAAAGIVAVAAVAAGWTVRPRPRDLGRAAAHLALFGVAFALCFVAGTPYAVLDAKTFLAGLREQRDHFAEGHGILIANAWAHHLTFSLRHGLGLPLLAAGLAGLPLAARRNPRGAAVVFAFPLVYFAIIGAGHTAFVRYTTPIVPFLCISAAVSAVALVRALAPRAGGRAQAAATALVATVLAAPSIATVVRFNTVISRTDTRVLAAEWLKPRLGDRAVLYESAASWGRVHFAWGEVWGTYRVVEFHQPTGQFTHGGLPDWIVIAEPPPRLYAGAPPQMRSILAEHYDLAHTVSGVRGLERERWFDRQDAYFLPYADLSLRERPGPTLRIYRRRTP